MEKALASDELAKLDSQHQAPSGGDDPRYNPMLLSQRIDYSTLPRLVCSHVLGTGIYLHDIGWCNTGSCRNRFFVKLIFEASSGHVQHLNIRKIAQSIYDKFTCMGAIVRY